MIGLGLVPLGGDSEEKGGCMGRHPPWGVSGSSHRLGAPVLGSYVEETSPLADWRNAGTDRKDGEAWTPLMSSEHNGLPLGRMDRNLH